jgi:hypothetical protein
MGRKGDAYDNALCEAFFATLNREVLRRCPFRTREEARSVLFAYLEGFYNRRRRHSALGYLSPEEFERRWPADPESVSVTPSTKAGYVHLPVNSTVLRSRLLAHRAFSPSLSR